MKNYLTFILFLLVCHISNGQEPVAADSTSTSFGLQMEKLATDAVFYLKTNSDSCLLITKSQMRTIREKWVDKIDVSTKDDVRKKFGFKGKQTLIFITLKKKDEKKFLELMGSEL